MGAAKMETNHEHFINRLSRKAERGNALVYVLIAIALFAALSFTLSRQTDTGEAGEMPDDRAELYATQLVAYAVQTKSVVDQMLFTGTQIDNLDFMLPTDAGFNAGTQTDKSQRVYHPEGGGLNPATLPSDAIDQIITDPPAGWYMGRFNNVEWSPTAADDVILTAFQINKKICEKINMKVNGTTAIPVLTAPLREVMISATSHTGANADLTTDPAGTPVCGSCHKVSSLCVQNQGSAAYGFYTIIADQ